MRIDIDDWKPFLIRDIFSIENGKGITQEEIEENPGTLAAVQSGEENNGVIGWIDMDYCVTMNYTIATTPCLTVARSGSAGYVSFQSSGCVVGDSAKLLQIRDSVHANEFTYLFLRTVLSHIRYKYSYGRKVTKDKYAEEIIKLPSLSSGQPDWQFMEDYIKSLHYKPIITQNENSEHFISTNAWKEFRIPHLFFVYPGKYHYADEYEEGLTPYISASDTNNAISSKISLAPDFEGNKITIGKVGATAYYQNKPFCATSDVNILSPKFEMSKYIGLFIVNILNFSENYKWSYGRQCRVGDTKEIIIKLPILSDNNGIPILDEEYKFHEEGYIPDWQYMEDYIKRLPYGDRI